MSGCLTYIYNLPCQVCGAKFTGAPWHVFCPKCWKNRVDYYRKNKIIYGKMTNIKEIKCERCGEIMNPEWCSDDHLDRDVCKECQSVIDDEEL